MGCITAEILLDFTEAIITAKHCADVFTDLWPAISRYRGRVGTGLSVLWVA
jgi:hypothetical protein